MDDVENIEARTRAFDAFHAHNHALDLSWIGMTFLPEPLQWCSGLERLDGSQNHLSGLPEWIDFLSSLRWLNLYRNNIAVLPTQLGNLASLEYLDVSHNELRDLPSSLSKLPNLHTIVLEGNPLNPELAAAYQEGFEAVKDYLRRKAEAHVPLYEAKMILVGEGEVGKSSLLAALRRDKWLDNRPTTHGIVIRPLSLMTESSITIRLNCWDFGGQPVYRPTHQLFFSSSALYLVVWKPRQGVQQNFVAEWITLIKQRASNPKIVVVATHGGPGDRLPDIDRLELWDLFGKETILSFHHVDSKPNPATGSYEGIAELEKMLIRVALDLPGMGRPVPRRWQEARESLAKIGRPFTSLNRILHFLSDFKMDEEEASRFIQICHRLGDLMHYEHDPVLQGVVVLKPDWLANAISAVLNDKQIRANNGLVPFQQLCKLWSDPNSYGGSGFPENVHPVFLRLMERFDLCYRVVPNCGKDEDPSAVSLVAQLVPDVRPSKIQEWDTYTSGSESERVQVCHISESATGRPAAAEGLIYQLIVRFHRFSLGRQNYADSVHWKRGLVLDDDYNGRALVERFGTDIRIAVKAAYPERFVSVLTSEVKYLVESFWPGLRCEIMVPCINPCGRKSPGLGLFGIERLVKARARLGQEEYPCPVCYEWQKIDELLGPIKDKYVRSIDQLQQKLNEVSADISVLHELLEGHVRATDSRLKKLTTSEKRILSRIDDVFSSLLTSLMDEAINGPRLFSIVPVATTFFDRPKWVSERFRITLWCEHSRLPLPLVNGPKSADGVVEINLSREWLVRAAPLLEMLSGTLKIVLPAASLLSSFEIDRQAYELLEKESALSEAFVEQAIKIAGVEVTERHAMALRGSGVPIRAENGAMRELHALLREKSPGFGGLVRVRDRRGNYLWVHPNYAHLY